MDFWYIRRNQHHDTQLLSIPGKNSDLTTPPDSDFLICQLIFHMIGIDRPTTPQVWRPYKGRTATTPRAHAGGSDAPANEPRAVWQIDRFPRAVLNKLKVTRARAPNFRILSGGSPLSPEQNTQVVQVKTLCPSFSCVRWRMATVCRRKWPFQFRTGCLFQTLWSKHSKP